MIRKQPKLKVTYGSTIPKGITIHNLRVEKPHKPYDVKCDRSGPLGNPVGSHGDESKRDWACDYYADWFKEEVLTGKNIQAYTELMRIKQIYEIHKQLRIFCWCTPRRCHTQTIATWLTEDIISSFRGDNAFLSNFYTINISIKGKVWKSSEAMYMACKTTDSVMHEKIRLTTSAAQAKRLGKTVRLIDGWEHKKDEVMLKCLRLKFTLNQECKDKLLATGTANLIEGNTWHDNYWGNCTCPKCTQITGRNQLGKTLMQVRSELQMTETRKFYTGVGSRNTPKNIIELMTAIAKKFEDNGFTLRSGGALGADQAFEAGTTQAAIYKAEHATPAAMEIAAQFHPVWHKCSEYARKLHGRNAFQVLGGKLNNPSNFLICWTQDGCVTHADRTIKTGGTGTAISIANHYNVPVFNLSKPEHLNRLKKWLENK